MGVVVSTLNFISDGCRLMKPVSCNRADSLDTCRKLHSILSQTLHPGEKWVPVTYCWVLLCDGLHLSSIPSRGGEE